MTRGARCSGALTEVGQLPQRPSRRRQRPEVGGKPIGQRKRQPLAVWRDDRMDQLPDWYPLRRDLGKDARGAVFGAGDMDLVVGAAIDRRPLDDEVECGTVGRNRRVCRREPSRSHLPRADLSADRERWGHAACSRSSTATVRRATRTSIRLRWSGLPPSGLTSQFQPTPARVA